jgi:glutamate carboxypeptidase
MQEFFLKFFPLILVLLSFQSMAQTSRERLESLVKINSGSENIGGVNQVQEIAKGWFTELGFKVELIANPEGEKKSGKLLEATLKGESSKFVTFVMHADTVFEPSSPFQKIIELDDNKLRGPGVIDDKGGIVVTYLALKEFLATNSKPKYSIRILVSPNEELGSPGFGNMFKKYSTDSFMVLGIEPSHENGIVHSRKGNIWYEIEVTGKEAHAGRHHEDGINACQILADKITQLEQLTDYKTGVTLSIGHMEGGQDKFNIVCGKAKAKLDVRTPSLQLRKETMTQIEQILKGKLVKFIINDDTLPFSMNHASEKYIERYLELIRQVEGKRPAAHSSGGVGDTNHFSREGVIIIDGLGPMGEEVHTENEFILLKTIDSRAKVLSLFLKEVKE